MVCTLNSPLCVCVCECVCVCVLPHSTFFFFFFFSFDSKYNNIKGGRRFQWIVLPIPRRIHPHPRPPHRWRRRPRGVVGVGVVPTVALVGVAAALLFLLGGPPAAIRRTTTATTTAGTSAAQVRPPPPRNRRGRFRRTCTLCSLRTMSCPPNHGARRDRRDGWPSD